MDINPFNSGVGRISVWGGGKDEHVKRPNYIPSRWLPRKEDAGRGESCSRLFLLFLSSFFLFPFLWWRFGRATSPSPPLAARC